MKRSSCCVTSKRQSLRNWCPPLSPPQLLFPHINPHHAIYANSVSSLSRTPSHLEDMAVALVCEIGHSVPVMWSDKLVIKERQLVRDSRSEIEPEKASFLRGISIWSCLLPFLCLRRRGWVTKTGERTQAKTEWRQWDSQGVDGATSPPGLQYSSV